MPYPLLGPLLSVVPACSSQCGDLNCGPSPGTVAGPVCPMARYVACGDGTSKGADLQMYDLAAA